MPIDLAAQMAAVLGRPVGAKEAVAVAVSGGPDSLALLVLATQRFEGRTWALTVDHGLRDGSAAEAEAVAAICAARGVPQATLRWDGPKPRANLQAAARAARYALMSGWCATYRVPLLLTAHHADDQAETLLMRLARGSGSSGLSAIRAVRALTPDVTLVRPLLSVRKAALAAVVAEAGLIPIDDPSNRDARFDRTLVRAALAATPWFDPQRLAESAARLADAEAALDWAADRAWAGRADVRPDSVTLDAAGLPGELVHRLTVRALLTLAPDGALRGDAVTRFIAALSSGKTATLAGIRASGGAVWRFSKAAPRR